MKAVILLALMRGIMLEWNLYHTWNLVQYSQILLQISFLLTITTISLP